MCAPPTALLLPRLLRCGWLCVRAQVCFEAILKGSISTLEIEIELLSVAAYAGVVFKNTLPPPLGIVVPFLKPEVWLTLWLWLTAADLVRTPALVLSFFFVAYNSIFCYFRPPISPFNLSELLSLTKEVDKEAHDRIEKIAKMGGGGGAEQV